MSYSAPHFVYRLLRFSHAYICIKAHQLSPPTTRQVHRLDPSRSEFGGGYGAANWQSELKSGSALRAYSLLIRVGALDLYMGRLAKCGGRTRREHTGAYLARCYFSPGTKVESI